MEEKITLTLTPDEVPAPKAELIAKPGVGDAVEQAMQQTILTPEEQQMVDNFAKQIDLHDTAAVMQYGAAGQKKVADFSDTALQNVKTKDLGEAGKMMTELVTELKGFSKDGDEKGLLGLFKKKSNKLEAMKARYATAEVNVERIQSMLEQHQVTLLTDIKLFDKMYDMNLNYFKELTMYIMAGKKALGEARDTELVELVEKAQRSNLPEDAQAAKDFEDMCLRFEKKLYDLELTRNISIQMAPQIRLIQNNDTMMAEKIQTSIVNTIPLWKSQMVIALGLANSQAAIEAQRAVSDMTNQLLLKNAEALNQGTIAAATESERGIVDIETLTNTNKMLIDTMDEVLKIQSEGHEKRAAAEQELNRIEGELKQKLLEVNTVTGGK